MHPDPQNIGKNDNTKTLINKLRKQLQKYYKDHYAEQHNFPNLERGQTHLDISYILTFTPEEVLAKSFLPRVKTESQEIEALQESQLPKSVLNPHQLL